jgi:hypothetical protein
MWISIRLILAALGFGFRFWRRRWPSKVGGEHKGAPYYLKKHKKMMEKATAVTIGMPMETRSWIRMDRESRIDRFFKRIGIGSEMQTGDPEFDKQVYVTSDHPAVATLLAGSAALRAAVMRSLGIIGATCVRYDGRAIWIDEIPGSEVTPLHLDTLAELREASIPLSQAPNRWFVDHFLWKALLIEGVIWAIFGYAIGACIEYAGNRTDLHLWTDPLIRTGLLVALLAFVGILASIALWMRGSSRGHRILVESAAVLALGLPITGVQVVADSNRALDDSPAQTVILEIDRCEVRESGSRRKTETYYALVYPSPDRPAGQLIPSEIRVTQRVCYALRRGNVFELQIGAGRWGFPWYRQIRTGDETWTAPL